jgi:hypothetical protein
MKNKILYVEISTAHTEIIKSFVDAMTPENEVQLLINNQSLKRIQNLTSKIQVIGLNEENYLSEILKAKKEFQPDLILLNSAQGRKVRDLCLRLLFDKTPIVGVHHNPENIYKSFTQKLIHWKIKKYVVLADFIKDFLKTKITNKKVQIASFYPLSFDQGLRFGIEGKDKYILIPGVLEQDRRDYLGFIEMVKQNDSKLDPKVKFVLLGNSKNHNGPQVVEKIKTLKLESRFIFFDTYVEDEIMLGYVEKCLAIMPLMHPGTRWFDKYFETKISGAYSLAFAFNKRLLMHEIFKGKKEFETHGVFYNTESLSDAVLKLEKLSVIEKPKKFDLQFQKTRLLDFLRF